MATVDDLWNALCSTIDLACQAANLSPAVEVFTDLPAADALSRLAHGGVSLVSVFDTNQARDVTRWIANTSLTPTIQAAIITSAVSKNTVGPGGTTTITIANQPALADAISAIVGHAGVSDGFVAIAIMGDTATTLATKLANGINASAVNTLIHATASINVVTITNISAVGISINSRTGNNGTQITELGRDARPILISAFTKLHAERTVLGTVIQQVLKGLQRNFGLQMPDGTWTRIKCMNDKPGRDTHTTDIFKWTFLIEAEQAVTTQDVLYSFLLPKTTLSN